MCNELHLKISIDKEIQTQVITTDLLIRHTIWSIGSSYLRGSNCKLNKELLLNSHNN